MTLTVTFALVFVAGPVVFWLLARRAPTRGNVIALWLIATAAVGLAFAVRGFGMRVYGIPPGLLTLVALWLAWIAVLALCVLAVRVRLRDARLVRGAVVMGAMATTLPWFGLYAAQTMGE